MCTCVLCGVSTNHGIPLSEELKAHDSPFSLCIYISVIDPADDSPSSLYMDQSLIMLIVVLFPESFHITSQSYPTKLSGKPP